MIHRIEPGYLRTNDALSQRDRRQRRQRRQRGDDDTRQAADDEPGRRLLDQHESQRLDLVA